MRVEGVDYQTLSSKLERWVVHRILNFLFGRTPIELDFLSGDIRKLDHPNPVIRVAPPKFWRLVRILQNPNYYFPAAYVDGFWYCSKGELSDFVLQLKNRKGRNTKNTGFTLGLGERSRHVYKHYVRPLSLNDAGKHYNTDVRLYKIVLGNSLVYSCAFFESEYDNLEEAQKNKLSITFRRAGLQSDENTLTLDIGCGWGSFIFYSAQRNMGRYHGISIAKSQIDYANYKKSKLSKFTSERLMFYASDYIDFRKGEENIYDHAVSIGMLEHVRITQYPSFFSTVHRLLKPGGRALVHVITRRQFGITNAWIDSYIFPGGHIPTISDIVRSIEESELELSSIHVHSGLNYKKTLQCWLDNLDADEDQCLELLKDSVVSTVSTKYTETDVAYQARRGYRIWKFYLSSIQCIFDRSGGAYDVTQFVLVKPSLRTFPPREL